MGKCGFPTHCRDSTPTIGYAWQEIKTKLKFFNIGLRSFNYPNIYVHVLSITSVMQCKNKCINETLINLNSVLLAKYKISTLIQPSRKRAKREVGLM